MALLDYTSADNIRAALGVSVDELEDATVLLEVYESNLGMELTDLDSTLEEKYLELKDVDVENMTSAEKRFYQAVRLFATYVVAKHLTSALPLFSPKEITDGKAAQSRYADGPYRDTIKSVNALYDKYRTWVVGALAALQSATAVPVPVRTYFTAVPSTRDPVTGT